MCGRGEESRFGGEPFFEPPEGGHEVVAEHARVDVEAAGATDLAQVVFGPEGGL